MEVKGKIRFKGVLVFIFVLSSWSEIVTGSFNVHNNNLWSKQSTVLDERQENTEFRLPLSVLPINYKLELMPILDPLDGYQRFTAPGKEWLTIECKEATSMITLHAINLTINSETISVTSILTGSNIQLSSISYTEEYDFLNIELSNLMEVGQQYEIFIEFLTPISSDALNGMYLDYYEDPDTGETKYIATTLFAPYHARRAFPCFDEPSFRATYDITIGHHKKYHSMSNTEISETEPVVGIVDYQWDTFKTTPSISSYIIAMIVSDLEYEQAPDGVFRNVSVRLYAKPDSIRKGAGVYSAKLSGDVMTFFESLFIVEYPISKLYSVALPQFFFSAMENWGLITYMEPVLLYLPGESTEEERYIINSVVSHEKAHQHFGNIVSCKWWAYVWLKEGFAQYFGHYGMNHTNPELKPWEQFITTVLQRAMEFDSSYETHPLENFPPTSAAVADIYTTIPYSKGASILRMASSIVSEPVFMDGIRLYVDRFQYQSAEQNDVFQSIQEAVDASPSISALLPASVKEILDTWTTQAGYPLLTVTIINSTSLQISQEKYIDGDPSNPSATWWVPLFISPRPDLSLPDNFPGTWIPSNTTSTIVNMNTSQTIILDPGSIGYYRVLYEPQMLDRIKVQLHIHHAEIPAVARSKLLNDYTDFAAEGIVDVETTLQLMSYLDQETDLVVWQGVLPFMDKLSRLLINKEYYQHFLTYFTSKTGQALTLIEAENDKNLEKGVIAILRSHLMKWTFQDVKAGTWQDDALGLLKKWMENPESDDNRIPVEMQEAIFCSAVKYDYVDNRHWNFFNSRFKNIQKSGSFSPISKRMLKAMTCTTNSTLLENLLNELLSMEDWLDIDENKKQDLLQYFVENLKGKDLVMGRLKNSAKLISLFKSDDDFRGFLKTLISYPMNETEIETLENLTNEVPLDRRSIILSQIQQLSKNLNFMSRSSEMMGRWFEYQAAMV